MWACDIKVGFSCGSCLPVVIEACRFEDTSEADDGVGAAERPFHAGLFETLADDTATGCLNDSRTYE